MPNFILLAQNQHYKNLANYIHRLLNDAIKVFGTNNDEIILFYAYLVNEDHWVFPTLGGTLTA